jgi:hypothetical protein
MTLQKCKPVFKRLRCATNIFPSATKRILLLCFADDYKHIVVMRLYAALWDC